MSARIRNADHEHGLISLACNSATISIHDGAWCRSPAERLTPKVLALVAEGRSYRLIGRELGLSKNTVVGIIKRNRAPSAES